VLKWSLVVLLPLTLGWKLTVRPADPGEIARDEKAAQLRVAEFLIRQHFSVNLAERMEEGKPSIRANAGACRLLIVKSPAMGWDRDLIRRNATEEDRVFAVFRGRVYPQQPTWLTVSDHLWARFWRELGVKAQAAPVLAVIAAGICDAERLPWNELV
jgi:hypothetical protein